MKVLVFSSLLIIVCWFKGVVSADESSENLGNFFYKELGCTRQNGKIVHYECPDLGRKNGSCRYKDKVLKVGEEVDTELLEGSCHARCYCEYDGHFSCANYDCFPQPLEFGCSHFRSSLDGCCLGDSVCNSTIMCNIQGQSVREGQLVSIDKKCEICICEKDFEHKAPFCRPRKCYDQARYSAIVTSFGAPVFFKDEDCCPSIWISDEGEKIIKMDEAAPTDSDLSCTFGERKVNLGYGFEKSVQPYGEKVSLKCQCSMPPLVICKEA